MKALLKQFDELKAANRIDDRIQLVGGETALPMIDIATDACRGSVYAHGGHVSHWQPMGREPVLFMSKVSHFSPGKPIRGGVPLVFPWFGGHATDKNKPSHGFARIRQWHLHDMQLEGDDAVITFTLAADDATRALWPHDFKAKFTVTFGQQLRMALRITNEDAQPFTFEAAMHTYFNVSDIHDVQVTGLAGRTYIDQLDGGAKKVQGDSPITFKNETDSIYIDSPGKVTVKDAKGGRTIVIGKKGSHATIVWNPWTDKSQRMADFGDNEWPGMLCIETANAKSNAVTLGPGDAHEMVAEVGIGD